MTTVDTLLADVRRAADVPAASVAVLLADLAARQAALAAVQTALTARLVTIDVQPAAPVAEIRQSRLLTPQQAADRLGVSRPWMYRHASNLPFTVRLTAKAVKFDEAGLERFIQHRRT